MAVQLVWAEVSLASGEKSIDVKRIETNLWDIWPDSGGTRWPHKTTKGRPSDPESSNVSSVSYNSFEGKQIEMHDLNTNLLLKAIGMCLRFNVCIWSLCIPQIDFLPKKKKRFSKANFLISNPSCRCFDVLKLQHNSFVTHNRYVKFWNELMVIELWYCPIWYLLAYSKLWDFFYWPLFKSDWLLCFCHSCVASCVRHT